MTEDPLSLVRDRLGEPTATDDEHARAALFDGRQTFVPPRLGLLAEEEGHLRIGPDRGLWVYQGGVYSPYGDEWLKGFVRQHLGEEFRENRLREVRAWCRANVNAHLETQPATDVINLLNGVLYWRESPPRLAPHDPALGSVIQLPVEWDPSATCDAFMSFLARVLPNADATECGECARVVLEWIGYLLIPSTKFKKALLLQGPADTGKSTLLHVLRALLGSANVATATLQSLEDNRFAASDLYGKLANVSADIDARALRSTGTFKMLVSGDAMRAERKYRDAFSYRPHARLVFSANEAPGTSDQSDAFYTRWLVLPMRRKVPETEQKRDLVEQLTTPEQLAGLLKLAVASLRRLDQRGRFDEPP